MRFLNLLVTTTVSVCVLLLGINPSSAFAAQSSCHSEIFNKISLKYANMGANLSQLGRPTTGITVTPDGDGCFQHYERGSIYASWYTDAYEIHGSIRHKWASLGWERSLLGYPTTDETPTPDSRGRFNHFEHGSIYWHPYLGAFEVHGAIRQKWADLGWERSLLGYPISDEIPLPDGMRFTNFEGGYIYWYSSIGAVVVERKNVYIDVNGVRQPDVPVYMVELRLNWIEVLDTSNECSSETYINLHINGNSHHHIWRDKTDRDESTTYDCTTGSHDRHVVRVNEAVYANVSSINKLKIGVDFYEKDSSGYHLAANYYEVFPQKIWNRGKDHDGQSKRCTTSGYCDQDYRLAYSITVYP
jgi:hypothetical protein